MTEKVHPQTITLAVIEKAINAKIRQNLVKIEAQIIKKKSIKQATSRRMALHYLPLSASAQLIPMAKKRGNLPLRLLTTATVPKLGARPSIPLRQ